MPFRLRYLAHDLELPIGEFVIGRSADCQLALDDPLVSRRHALLQVRRDVVTIRDLGSRNGVLVNGVRIEGQRDLHEGDKLQIGSQEMCVLCVDDRRPSGRASDDARRATLTLGANAMTDGRIGEATSTSFDAQRLNEGSKTFTSLQLLGGVADKALAMGRSDEAERILQAPLLAILRQCREGHPIDAMVAENAASYAARLAAATHNGGWVDYVFELFAALARPLPAPIIDDLYTIIRKVKSVDLSKLRAYVARLQRDAAQFGPAERFLVQRIEGLERLGALK